MQRQSKLCAVTAHCDDPGINESRVEAELNHSNSPSWGQMKINVDVPCEDRKEQLLSCGVRLGKIIFLGRFVATHQKLKRCLGREGLCTWQSKWLSLFQKKKIQVAVSSYPTGNWLHASMWWLAKALNSKEENLWTFGVAAKGSQGSRSKRLGRFFF